MTQAKKPKTRMGGTARAVTVVAAMSPLLAGIYQESQETRQRDSQRHAEQVARIEAKQEKEREESQQQLRENSQLDKQVADTLQKELLSVESKGPGLCNHLYFAAAQLRGQAITLRTRNVLQVGFRMRSSKDGSLAVCGCKIQGSNELWASEFLSLVQRSPDDPLTRAVGAAKFECEEAARPPGVKVTPSGAAHPDSVLGACAPISSEESRRLRVFVQVPDLLAKDAAERFRDSLNGERKNPATGFKSPGIEIVGSRRSPSTGEVRYTFEKDLPAAQLLASGMSACFGMEVKVRPLPNRGKTDTGVLEVWWPKPAQGDKS